MIERRKSKIAGWGVYATQPIPKNKRIIHYAGEKITHKESLEREQKYLAKGRIWCFTLNNRWVIDGDVGCPLIEVVDRVAALAGLSTNAVCTARQRSA